MKKIIILFLIFSAVVFAKWEVGTDYATDDSPITTFTTYDLEEGVSYIMIGVNVDSLGSSAIAIFHIDIEKGDNLVLIVTDNDGSDITCRFHEDDIKKYYVNVRSNRSTVLTKILYNGKSAVLINRKKDEILAVFDLSGIKQVMEKHVGSSYWYKYELNSIYD